MGISFEKLVLLRYAHIKRSRVSGGTEQYLDRLNRDFLTRHPATIIQMCIAETGEPCKDECEMVGRGKLIWAPVEMASFERGLRGYALRACRLARGTGLLHSQEHRGAPSVLRLIRSFFLHSGGHWRYPYAVFSERLNPLVRTYGVNLLAFHWVNYDSHSLARLAASWKIPYLLVNHHNNARLERPEVRRVARHAAAIAGVSDVHVPEHLRSRFFNVSDAIDTSFFSPCCPETEGTSKRTNIVLLPARVDYGKGHSDLLDIASQLASRGIEIDLCFAGATENEGLLRELNGKVERLNLQNKVSFLGDLTRDQLRDWYKRSALVALPSSSEGLPRVLLEAQAMERPVVAYDVGGTASTLVVNESGFLIPPGNLNEMGSKIELLVKDKELRLRMGRSGRDFICKSFSIERMISNHEQLYRSILQDRANACGPRGGLQS